MGKEARKTVNTLILTLMMATEAIDHLNLFGPDWDTSAIMSDTVPYAGTAIWMQSGLSL